MDSPVEPHHLPPPSQVALQARCRHPNGRWEPLDWLNPTQSIPERVAELARCVPDRVAVRDQERSLTFGELDAAANRVANAILAARGAGQEAVALLVGVDAQALIAALGILKTGKFYVGLDEAFPESHHAGIIEEAGVTLILADSPNLQLANELAGGRRLVLSLDLAFTEETDSPGVSVSLDDLALINFTSGSTGRPKGVMQTHRSAFVQAVRFASYYRLGDGDVVVFCDSLAWAGPFWDFCGPLCLGACVAPFDLRRHGIRRLSEWLTDCEATAFIGLVAVREIAHGNEGRRFPAVRVIHMGGDTIFRQDVEACQKVFPNAVVAVGLGTSEAGRLTELLLAPGARLEHDVAPIGYAVPGLRVLLLSEDRVPVPDGEIGEIAVASPHLSPGYWRRPELTRERFLRDTRHGDAPIYLTGDLGRRMQDGALQHLGRKDFQVKIRGYQVNTIDIEGALVTMPGVREAAVAVHHGLRGTQQLAAHLVVDTDCFAGIKGIRGKLRADFPPHMVPQSLVLLDSLPKTFTGKIDRPKLVPQQQSRPATTADHVAPRTPVEQRLATIWEDVLRVDGIGVRDDFLELGGDSLQSSRIIGRIVEQFKVECSHRDFYSVLTIEDMAAFIEKRT